MKGSRRREAPINTDRVHSPRTVRSRHGRRPELGRAPTDAEARLECTLRPGFSRRFIVEAAKSENDTNMFHML